MLNFSAKASSQKLCDLLTHSAALGLRESAEGLLDWAGSFLDIECGLGDSRLESRHVGWLPCKDILVLKKEIDERAFLCGGQVGLDFRRLGDVSGVDL